MNLSRLLSMVAVGLGALTAFPCCECEDGTIVSCSECPFEYSESDGYFILSKSVTCYECALGWDCCTYSLLNTGCTAEITKTDANGYTSYVFTYLDTNGQKQTIRYSWQDQEATGTFWYNGHTVSFWWDCVPLGIVLTVDGVEHAYILPRTHSSGSTPVVDVYKVTFNANGGSCAIASKAVVYESTYGMLPTPTRTGYTFDGWYTAASGGTLVTSGTTATLTADQTLYAHWTTSPNAVTLAEALDNTSLTFTTGGAAGWNGQDTTTHDGSDAARSGAVDNNKTSYLQTTVSGTGTLTFWWKVSSEAGCDFLHFYVDGSDAVAAISGRSGDWAQVSYTISTSGSHTLKWSYEKDVGGSIGVDCGWVDQVVWTPTPESAVTRTVTFNANGGSCTTAWKTVMSGSTYGTLPTPFRTGYRFVGWYTAVSGGSRVTSATTVSLSANQTLYAHWTVISYRVTFNANGGSCSTVSITVRYGSTYGMLPTATRTGYTFKGWFTAASGGTQVTSSTTAILGGDRTLYAHWTVISYRVTFDANGGSCSTVSITVRYGSTYGTLPTAMRTGYTFKGWFTAASGGTQVTSSTTAILGGNRTLYAHWERDIPQIALHEVPGSSGTGGGADPMDASYATVYDGVIFDASGNTHGSLSVKVAKAAKKTGLARVTATILVAGETRKVTVRGTVDAAAGTFRQAASDGRILALTFTHDGLAGTFDGYEIDGARNLLASATKADKGTAAKTAADAALVRLKGTYTLAFPTDQGVSGLSITVAAKGKVKVTGILANGTRVSATSALIMGDEYSCIPVVYTKKTASLAFSVYLATDGSEVKVFGLEDAICGPIVPLESATYFSLDESVSDLFTDGYTPATAFLPDGFTLVTTVGTKWVVAGGAPAGQIKLVDGELVDLRGSTNPSGLKLTYTAKTGLFKGSFKVYALGTNGKLKTFTATVNGVVVDNGLGGWGYGTATIKGYGSVSVWLGGVD